MNRHCEARSEEATQRHGAGLLGSARKDGIVGKALVLLFRAWQLGPSKVLPPSCRFRPSCSAYAITAIRRYGAAKGGWLATKRICRCHPWGGQGPDPVP